ncbi:hypothetical protein [Nocardioides sp. Soil777]|jgi:hypothetical protein|uniref:hypothetical protein n=1 Tax=Nocardioides sp. Soil777 TaxID=1736409 RepID=UPI000ABB7BCB|nr:hypothetical protein [Nocardioides sp. Soil777]
MPGTTRGALIARDLLAASAGGNQTLSTAVIGLFTLVSTVLIMYLIARGPRNKE